ncbi:MAG: cobalamin B12-binding domain-containing protein [Planctomycetes bacterium]|nr:cobalamin B12-binding domain-containing protein [Planctomycetota bacterium]
MPGRRYPDRPRQGGRPVNQEVLIERLFQALVNGNRSAAREIVAETLQAGISAEEVLSDLFWPTLTLLNKLHRADQLAMMGHHFATRLLRSLADQMQLRLQRHPSLSKRVLIVCGPTEQNELAACMAADLVEARGFDVSFAGGGVPADEVMARVGEHRPDTLLIFSSSARDLPDIRRMIDRLHEMNVCPHMQIVVGGGVFNRADGLAEEIGADLFVSELGEIASELVENADVRASPGQRTVGRKRRSNDSNVAGSCGIDNCDEDDDRDEEVRRIHTDAA